VREKERPPNPCQGGGLNVSQLGSGPIKGIHTVVAI